MPRQAKAIGLALILILALTVGSAAPEASTEEASGVLTSDGPVTLDVAWASEGVSDLTMLGYDIHCPESGLTGHETVTQAETDQFPELQHAAIETPATTITTSLHFNAETCFATGTAEQLRKTTTTTNGCDLHLVIGETLDIDEYAVSTDIECPKEKLLEFEIYGFQKSELGGVLCRTTIGTQTSIEGAEGEPVVIAADTDAETHDLEMNGTFVGIHAKRTGCEGAETDTSVAFHVSATLEGTDAEGAPTGITLTDARD